MDCGRVLPPLHIFAAPMVPILWNSGYRTLVAREPPMTGWAFIRLYRMVMWNSSGGRSYSCGQYFLYSISHLLAGYLEFSAAGSRLRILLISLTDGTPPTRKLPYNVDLLLRLLRHYYPGSFPPIRRLYGSTLSFPFSFFCALLIVVIY